MKRIISLILCFVCLYLTFFMLPSCATQKNMEKELDALIQLDLGGKSEYDELREKQLALKTKYGNQPYFSDTIISALDELNDQDLSNIIDGFTLGPLNDIGVKKYLEGRFDCSNKSVEEKIKMAFYLADLKIYKTISTELYNSVDYYDLTIKISKKELEEYLSKYSETIFTDNSGGYYSGKEDYYRPSGKFNTTSKSVTYLGDFMLENESGERLNGYYEIKPYRNSRFFFRGTCLTGSTRDNIEEFRFVSPYLIRYSSADELYVYGTSDECNDEIIIEITE